MSYWTFRLCRRGVVIDSLDQENLDKDMLYEACFSLDCWAIALTLSSRAPLQCSVAVSPTGVDLYPRSLMWAKASAFKETSTTLTFS